MIHVLLTQAALAASMLIVVIAWSLRVNRG